MHREREKPLVRKRALKAGSLCCHQLCGTDLSTFIPEAGLTACFTELLQGLKRLAESKYSVNGIHLTRCGSQMLLPQDVTGISEISVDDKCLVLTALRSQGPGPPPPHPGASQSLGLPEIRYLTLPRTPICAL